MKRIRATPDVAVDWTKCFGYSALVSEEIEHYSAIEVTEDLKEGGIAANRAWERWYRYLTAAWQTDFTAEIVAAARRFEAPRLLSLGCGYGGMEIACARQLGGAYEILAVDLNENLFRQAREEVARDGLNVEFQALDLNFAEIEESSFDVVFAHASLHHLLNFEHLFAQVYRGLSNGGRFIVLDIIGKTQVLFWPENIRFATDLVTHMPELYRRGLAADAKVLFSSYLDGAEQQGMEGIRQEELEEQIGRYFRPLKTFKYNSFVRLICTHPTIALAFDPERTEDQAYLDSLFRLDLDQISKGALRATEMFSVYEKRPRGELEEGAGPRNDARVSVCVACDGTAEELRTCVASLLAQTHRNVEVVLLAPTGGSEVAELARSLAVGDPRVRLAASASVRSVTEAATGEHIAFVSCRDSWYPVKLAEQLAFLEERPAAGCVYAQAIVVDDRGRRTSRAFGTEVVGEDISTQPLERLIEGAELPRSTVLFRRACWQQSELADSDPATDEDLCLRTAARWQIGFQERPMGMLRASMETAGEDRERRLGALERLRRDALRLGPRLAEPQIRAALDRRIVELGGSAEGKPPAPLPSRPRLLSRIARLLTRQG